MGKTKFFVRGPQGFLAKARLENYIGAVADRLESNLATPSLTASEAIEGNHVVVLGNLRTHLVHAVGGTVLNVAEFLRHAGKRWALLTTDEQIIVRYRHLKNSAAGVFGVMDGTFAGDGAGPRALRVFVKNYILASHDLVALDAVAAKMMGFDPLSIPYLRRLHEDGLGCADPGSIEVDGIDINGIDFRFHTLASPQSRLLSRIAGEDRLKHTNTGRFGRLRTSFLEALQDFYIRKMWQNRTGKYRLALAHSSSWGRLMDKYNLTLPNQLTQDNR
ncbi:MAG: DUF362 domain-containing protein [Candidatus Omnitrophica bacterium]|nr:DUF362 domain-containing protein [Candidatus Omnitrophota bacterium]